MEKLLLEGSSNTKKWFSDKNTNQPENDNNINLSNLQ